MKLVRLSQEIMDYFRNPNTESSAKPPSKLQISILLLLLLVAFLLYLKNYNTYQLGAYWDDAEYAVLAQSIAQSESYGLINGPGDPEPSRYPVGFPLLLSIFVTLFPQLLDQLKVVSLLFTLLVVILLFWGWPYLSRLKSYWWGLIIASIYALSPIVIDQSRMVMSEPAFTAFMLIALILTEKYLTANQKRPLWAFLVGIVTVFAFFIRFVGIALVIAIVIRILILQVNKSFKWEWLLYMMLGGIFFLLFVISITPITVHDLLPSNIYYSQSQPPEIGGQSSTQDQLDTRERGVHGSIQDQLFHRLSMNFSTYARYFIRSVVVPIGGGLRESEFSIRLGTPSLPIILGLIITVCTLLGSLLFYKRQGLEPTILIFEVLYFGLLLLWIWSSPRLLYPILPFLVYQFLWGVWFIIKQFGRLEIFKPGFVHNLSNYVLISAVFIIIIISIIKGATGISNSLHHTRDLRVGATWLRENSQPDSRIMAQQPQSIYLYSQRKTIDQQYFSSPAEIQKSIHENDINYILVAPELQWRTDGALIYDKFTSEKFIPMLEELLSMGELRLVFNSDKDMVAVYQVVE